MVGAADDARFFRTLAIIMAAVLVIGFSVQLAMGRSSFAAPLVVHIHAVVFMAWLGIFVAQSWLAASGRIAQHRWFGRLAAGWTLLMLVMGVGATVGAVQQGRVPFFFLPQHFLVGDIATLVCFAALTALAIRWRRQTDWHWRLHLCAMAALMGPGFGRLLPMPFMRPWAFEIAALCGLVFPAIAAARDARRGAALCIRPGHWGWARCC
jgi:hypothetical protein